MPNAYVAGFSRVWLVALLLTGCAPNEAPSNSESIAASDEPRDGGASMLDAEGTEADREELLRLNAELFRSQIVDRDSALFVKLAVPSFRVLAPGGMIEGMEQAIAGLQAWNVTAVSLTGTDVVFHGPVAIVFGRLDIDGEMRPVGRWGPLKHMSTWVREDGDWRIVARSLTPCLPPLIELGRC